MAWKVKKHKSDCDEREHFAATMLLFSIIDKDGVMTEPPTQIDEHFDFRDGESVECASCGAKAHWEDDPQPTESDEDIDVIASGYEWTCPGCGDLRKEIEIKPRFVCKKCNLSYAVSDYEHAIE
jgi:DNA-directed RNA polymerase subunit RPC12/RpoP